MRWHRCPERRKNATLFGSRTSEPAAVPVAHRYARTFDRPRYVGEKHPFGLRRVTDNERASISAIYTAARGCWKSGLPIATTVSFEPSEDHARLSGAVTRCKVRLRCTCPSLAAMRSCSSGGGNAKIEFVKPKPRKPTSGCACKGRLHLFASQSWRGPAGL